MVKSIKQRKEELEREIEKNRFGGDERIFFEAAAELKGITFAQAEMLKRIENKFDFKEEDKLCFWKKKEDNTWSRNVIDFVKELKSQLEGGKNG